MTFSPLADTSRRIPDGGRSVPRQSAVTGFGIHHNAGVDSYGEATNPRREVSANYWIANNGTIIPNIDETRRAFTSGAAGYPAGALADHRNITVEVSNSPEGVRTGTWAISEAAMNSLVALIADVYGRYGLGAVERSATRGLGVHQDWVPTSCPGPYIMDNLGVIIARANEALFGAPPKEEEPQRRVKTMFGLMINDGAGKYGKPGARHNIIVDPVNKIVTRLSDEDADGYSQNIGHFGNVTYVAWDLAIATYGETIVNATGVSPVVETRP